MARVARDRGSPILLLTGVTLATEEFGLIAGDAAEGTLFIDPADPRGRPEAAPLVVRFRAAGFEPEGYTIPAYGSVQVWAQAAEKAGALEIKAMIKALRENQFDTVLGPIDFDEKGISSNKTSSCMSGGAASTCHCRNKKPIARETLKDPVQKPVAALRSDPRSGSRYRMW